MINNFLNFHKKLIFKNADFSNHRILISLIILFFLSVIINYGARYYEKTVWDKNPHIFSSEGLPLVRTGDPAYFVKQAQYLKENKPSSEYNNKLWFPTILSDEIKPPLLSKIIALMAKDSSIKEIVKAGNQLVLLSSILTTFGVFFLFYVIGRPFEGIIASTAGTLSLNYLMRSSIGYIDTDILNLFFFYFLFGFIYLSSKQKTWIKNIITILVTGLLGKSLLLWFPKPEIILLSFFSLVFFTWFNTKDWKRLLFNSFIYILITGPTIYFNSLNILISNPYLSSYLSANVQSIDLVEKTDLNFNNIFRYIGEQTKIPLLDLFKVEGSIYLGIVCFLGFILWGITYPILFIGFAPLSLFFLLSTIMGVRAIIYSGPFIWFGSIYLINFIFFKLSSLKTIQFNKNYIYIFTSLSFLVIFLLNNNVFNRYIATTYISNNITKAMISMNNIVNDKDNSVFVAQWTYGYQSLLYNDMPVLIHPGTPTDPRHYFIERANTSFDLEETSKILNYVASGNVEKIKENEIDTFQKLSKHLYNAKKIDKDIYLMVTQQQRLWIPSSAAVAYWDIENNTPYLFTDKVTGKKSGAIDVFNILEINCDDLDVLTLTTMCADSEGSTDKYIPVNLALGLWNKEPRLKRVVQIVDGKVEINQEYENSKGNTVFQIVKNTQNNTSNLYLMHEAVFKSTYNRLFHLNDSKNYELVYDDYPHVKIYKIN